MSDEEVLFETERIVKDIEPGFIVVVPDLGGVLSPYNPSPFSAGAIIPTFVNSNRWCPEHMRCLSVRLKSVSLTLQMLSWRCAMPGVGLPSCGSMQLIVRRVVSCPI